ncbi:MAG: OmpA family protein [Alphaproteobacteria bacterium]|nr:OmpA family protein [Alphaproteobacteria bacterium]
MTQECKNKTAGSGAVALLTALAILWPLSEADAQVVIGGGGGPAVITDFGAIDDPYGMQQQMDGQLSGFIGPGGPLLIPDPGNPPRSRLLVQPAELGTTYPLPPGRQPAVATFAPTPIQQPASAGQRIVLRKPGETRPTPAPAPAPAAAPAPAPAPAPVAAPAAQPEPAQAPERPAAPPPAPEIAAAPPPPPPAEAPPAAQPEPQPEPQPAPAPAAQPESQPAGQVASLPPAGDLPTPGNPIRITFESGSIQLSGTAQKTLGDMAASLRQSPDLKIQLNGFASAPDGSTSQARRTALLRTLAVRTFLIDAGVERLRMDVRALGDRTDTEPKDRVDIEALTR